MYANYEKKILGYLREIQDIAEANMPNGKYLQVVNRAGKIVSAMHRSDRREARGTGYKEFNNPAEYTGAAVRAECDKHATDRQIILDKLLAGETVTTVDCINMNILRAGHAIYVLRKKGYDISTTRVPSGRSRIAAYRLETKPQNENTQIQ